MRTLNVADAGILNVDCDGLSVYRIRGLATQFDFVASLDVDQLIVGVLDSGDVIAIDVDGSGRLSGLPFQVCFG